MGERLIKRAVIGLIACVLAGTTVMPAVLADEVPLVPPDSQAPLAIPADDQPDPKQAPSESEKVTPVPEPPTLLLAEEPPLQIPPLIIHRVTAGGAEGANSSYDYIELFNPNSHDVFVDSWKVRVTRNEVTDKQQEFTIKGTVRAKGYVLIAGSDKTFFDVTEPDFRLNVSMIYDDGRVQLADAGGAIIDQVAWGSGVVDATAAKLNAGEMLEHIYISEGVPLLLSESVHAFSVKTPAPRISTPRTISYQPYLEPINRCAGLMISEIAANVATDRQFVELYNSTSLPIILDGCLLQTNRSTTKSFALKGTLNPGKYRAIPMESTGLTLTKTTSGTVYVLSSDAKEETDARSYDGLAVGTSWSWFGGGDWRQTFSLSAGAANKWQEFLPCEAGYERNRETGRCRKIVVETPPADCGPGKYRNPETNRCRSVTAAAVLTPCKLGQYRNPETNRCRSLTTTANALKPCRPNQQRNPDTNRCRNVMSDIPASAFAVEPIKETGKAFVGWWALGGLGVLAVGYGVWEWRSEMLAGIRKLGSFFTSGK